jgi:predicted pyridoxine 5'-phosphate oxidase superfamily flavin-nucleotide-binding protein
MTARFFHEVLTPEVLRAQEHAYGRSLGAVPEVERDVIGPDEREMIAERDSFYLATAGSTGWPYVQHRGGPKGFLRVVDEHTLGFADLRGNRQLVSTGNVASSDKVALILMDYPSRQRLKILGHARLADPHQESELAERLAPSREQARSVERLVLIDVVAFDWNCPAHITPRFTLEEIAERVAPLHRRIAELEALLSSVKGGSPD